MKNSPTLLTPSSSYSSQLSLPINPALLPNNFDRNKERASFTAIDAKPYKSPSGVNLNYQSPYRGNSAVYKSASVANRKASLPATPTTSIFSNSTPVKPISSPAIPAINNSKKLPNIQISQPSKKHKVLVKKTGRLHDQTGQIPTYKTVSKKRGKALIINNIMFKDDLYRKGAQIDEETAEELFKQMGFKVEVKKDLKKSVK